MTNLMFAFSFWAVHQWLFAAYLLRNARNRGVKPPAAVKWLYYELRPFYLPAVAAYAVVSVLLDVPLWLVYLASISEVVCWQLCKNMGDDDRWKRRRKKLADKVSQLGARLTVVPASGP